MVEIEEARPRCGAIVLAAGNSTRMGRPKQLLEINGQTLLQRTVSAALNAEFWPIIVVLGASQEMIRPSLAKFPVILVNNPDWNLGMSSSVRCGVAQLRQFSRQTDATLLAVCDQPGLSEAHLRSLKNVFRANPAHTTAARYSGRLGTPAIFPRTAFESLAKLEGDRGARDLLRDPGVVGVDLPELELDLDTPEEYAAGLVRFNNP